MEFCVLDEAHTNPNPRRDLKNNASDA